MDREQDKGLSYGMPALFMRPALSVRELQIVRSTQPG